MSHPSNYIDLTIESDDEVTHRNHSSVRSQQNSTARPYQSNIASQQYQDESSYSTPGPSILNVHQRQQAVPHPRDGTERQSLVSSTPRRETEQQPLVPSTPRHGTERQSLVSPTSRHGTERQSLVPLTPRHGTERQSLVPSTSRSLTLSHTRMASKEANSASAAAQTSSATTSPAVMKPLRKACVNCAEVNVTCDGERPCSACVEPGLLCYYPGENLSTRRFNNISLRTTKPKPVPTPVPQGVQDPSLTSDIVAPRVETPSAVKVHTTQQSDLLPNPLLNVDASVSDSTTPGVSLEDDFYDSDESDDDEVPLAIADLEEVKRLLKKHESRMRDHRAYLLQPLLNQAKLDAAKAPGPHNALKIGNPFTSLIARNKRHNSATSSKASTLQIQIKSHKSGAPKKWTQMSIPLKIVDTDPTILPKYKSIGRLGTSLLAPNIRTLKYWPYFPDEENLEPSEAKKNEELEERYQHDDNHLLAQRKCSELVDMWRPWVKDFVSKLRIEFSDILYWFLHTTDKTTCEMCERDIVPETFTEISRLLTRPTERSLTLARLSTIALDEVAKISMWHFVLGAPSVKDLMKQLEPFKKNTAILCSVCFLYNCLTHGAYQEPEESGGAVIMGVNVEINDEEANHNIHVSAAVPNRDHDAHHQCSLYCVAAEVRVKDILGRRKDGKVGGIHNHGIHVPRLTFDNDVTCSDDCYWQIEKRTKFGTVLQTKDYLPKLSEKWMELFRHLLRIYSDNQRAPCMIAKEVEGLACIDAFYSILAETHRISHYRQAAANAAQQGTRKISKLAAGQDTTLSADLDERPPFVPCSHSGICLNNPECTCHQDKVHCEWFCGCDKSCDRRFPGCKCASANKTCFNDKNCECWKHNRECDPWLCSTCGVVEVLDPQNKYKENIRQGRCKNNRIQLELPARTIKAPSEVQGWGLYAGADLEENAFIGEYKGETVGNQESDRRGAVYANIGQEYLFVMNRDQQIDGSNFGNKTRFINNSQRDDYINVFAKKLLCNGVQRVMLYAKKPIRAGEELLYNYNYPVSVTKKFWERGEGPTSVPGAAVAKPSITWTQPRVNGRFAKVAGQQDEEPFSSERTTLSGGLSLGEQESMAKRDAKRKRASAGDLPLVSTGASAAAKVNVSKDTTQRMNGDSLFPDDVEDSDFELIEASESSESVEAVEDDSDQGEGSMTAFRRRRIVHPNDRRRGGLAQAKAWETRRKRTTVKGK